MQVRDRGRNRKLHRGRSGQTASAKEYKLCQAEGPSGWMKEQVGDKQRGEMKEVLATSWAVGPGCWPPAAAPAGPPPCLSNRGWVN